MERGRSRGGSVVKIKKLQTRRAWSNREEAVLITSLKDLIGKGWKCDNGFRAGYLVRLEESLVEAFPGTDIKAYPHVNSKLTGWKRTYATLTTALARSGVGFNERTCTLDCTDETWELIVKADKNAENMRYKSFPMYPISGEFFGKDRADDQRAEDVLDAFNNLMKEDQAGNSNMVFDVDLEVDQVDEDGEGNSVCGASQSQFSTKSQRKRRKMADGNRELHELVGSIVTNTNELKDVSKFIGYEFGLGQKREQIFNQLTTLPDISDLERYDLAEFLSSDSDKLEMFMGLPLEHKGPFA